MSSVVQLAGVARRAVQDYLAVARGEHVVILVDSQTSASTRSHLRQRSSASAGTPSILFITARSSGQEAPEAVLRSIEAGDVVITAASRFPVSLESTVRAQAVGTRGGLELASAASGFVPHIAGVENATSTAELGSGHLRVSSTMSQGRRSDGAQPTWHIVKVRMDTEAGVRSSVHIDVIVDRVTIEIDGNVIVENGELKF